jgi:hypothetical protein
MSLSEIYNIKGGRLKIKEDKILSIISEMSLMIMNNINILLGLINDIIIEFYGFMDSNDALIHDEIIVMPPAYILIKLKHDIGIEIALSELPSSVVGIKSI